MARFDDQRGRSTDLYSVRCALRAWVGELIEDVADVIPKDTPLHGMTWNL
jgi:hypothetical protein